MPHISALARRRARLPLALGSVGLVCSLVLGACGSSTSDGGTTTTEAAPTTSSSTTQTTLSVTTTTPPATTTTTTAVPADLTPEETAVAFVRAIVEGRSADGYVRDPAVAADAERQLGEMGQAAYDTIALDPVTSQEKAGAPDACAVNDVTLTCYVLIDRSSSDSEGVNTLLAVGVAVNDLSQVTDPADPGAKVAAYVTGVEVVPG